MVIRSFPFGCTTEHVDAVISTSSYREAGNCGVVRRNDSRNDPEAAPAGRPRFGCEGRAGDHLSVRASPQEVGGGPTKVL